MGPCLSGRQFSPAPRDRKLLPSVCGSGRHSARDWASPPPHPYISLHPSPPPEQHRGWGGGRPLNPLTSLHGPWEQQSERDSSRPLHRHQQPLQKLKPKQTSCPPGPCLRNNHKNMTSTIPPAEGKAWPFAQVRVHSCKVPPPLGGPLVGNPNCAHPDGPQTRDPPSMPTQPGGFGVCLQNRAGESRGPGRPARSETLSACDPLQARGAPASWMGRRRPATPVPSSVAATCDFSKIVIKMYIIQNVPS